MTKLGQIIEPMKESFIVAFLAWEGAKEEDMAVSKEVIEARERYAAKQADRAAKSVNTDPSDANSKSQSPQQVADVKMEDTSEKTSGKNGGKNGAPEKISNGSENKEVTNEGENNGPRMDTKPDEPASSTGASAELQPDVTNSIAKPDGQPSDDQVKEGEDGGTEVSDEVKKKLAVVQRDGKFAAMEARKRTIEGHVKSDAPPSSEKDAPKAKSPIITVKDRKGRLVKVLDDDEEEMDCEFLNNRQLFLELCQTNNYQFDQTRRAKHSSMMVLWHLHNRDAPKFVQQCAVCAREILAGYRYHCPTCADFDLCQDCYQKPQVQRHQHPLKPIAVVNTQKNEQTDEQRRERQRSIQLHMTLLLHAATCKSPKCHSQNCAKMKGLLQHGEQCPTKAAGGCNVCKRIWTLLQIHARQCKEVQCPVPKCLAIRERFRQIAAQQRAMDDRRRQQMNIHYRQNAS